MILHEVLQEKYNKPHLSYSSVKNALKDMRLFDLYMSGSLQKESDALRFGTMYDMLLFERDKAFNTYVVLNNEVILERCSDKTKSMKSPSATNEYKEAKAALVDEYAAEGKVICSPEDWQMANEMIDRLNDCKLVSEYMNGQYQVMITKEILDGVLVKGVLDCLCKHHIVDSKSTRSVDGFRWDVNSFGYDIQAYLYTAMTGIERFYWVAQEKTYPYLPALVECTEDTIFRGEVKFRDAVARIKKYLSEEKSFNDDYLVYRV